MQLDQNQAYIYHSTRNPEIAAAKADQDADLLRAAQALMQALPAREIRPDNIAYLTDRILMYEGKPQIYGTQYKWSGDTLRLWMTDDIEHVDERRASVGLETVSENEARIRRLYG